MAAQTARSAAWFARAQRRIPGGVNSPVRSYRAVGVTPPRFVARAEGALVYDEDGNRYVDFVGSYGPLILGHAHPRVVRAVQEAAARGTSYGAPTAAEVELAELVCRVMPAVEMVRLVNSGTEATLSAVRLARAYTGRRLLVKFAGCYHGHADAFLVRAGSGALTLGNPDSPGVPPGVAADTAVLPFNDLAAVQRFLRERGKEVAAVIAEGVPGNMGVVVPRPGFLTGLQEACREVGALFILDEVMTGFRVALGGVQERFGLSPDLVCLGKILGGGLPIGAYGGRAEIMRLVAPEGPVYQAGTLSGNPLATAAGLATLSELVADPPYARLEERTASFAQALREAAREVGVPVTVSHVGSMFTVFFHPGPVENEADALSSHRERFRAFFAALLEEGVLWPPSPFEAAFLSTAHDDAHLELALRACRAGLAAAARVEE